MGASAFEPLFFGSGGSMFSQARVGISPAEEGWTVANDHEMYLVAAPTCNVLQHT
jgi:hypothetical protein